MEVERMSAISKTSTPSPSRPSPSEMRFVQGCCNSIKTQIFMSKMLSVQINILLSTWPQVVFTYCGKLKS